jgi:carbon-monoxide dehydrogenase medium subunit
MTRHRVTAASSLARGHRVVREAAAAIASPAIRSMGTMGGSIAFADPGADYPAALVAAAAVIHLRGPDGRREVAAEDFFVDWYATGLEPGELVEAIVLPPAAATSGGAYVKLSRVEGDYATASAAAVVDWRQGRCHAIRVAVGGCGPTPVRVAEDTLIGSRLDAAAVADLGRRLAAAADPVDDMRGSAGYRRRVIPTLVARAIAQAVARAEEAA